MKKPDRSHRINLFVAGTVTCLVMGGVWAALRLGGGTPPERLVYRSVDGADLTLDIYRPVDWSPSDHRPCVIWLFGGVWEAGAPHQYRKQSLHLARSGLVCITPDYRVRSRHGREITPFDSLEDARAAIQWVRARAGELGIDPRRIAAAGGSSGGHLAAACASVPAVNDGNPPTSSVPDALILYNPVVDFNIPFVAKRTTADQRERLATIAPLHQLNAPLPPTVVFHGTADAIIPIRTSETFVQKAREVGSPDVVLISYPGKGHEFHLAGAVARREAKESMRQIERFLGRLGWVEKD